MLEAGGDERRDRQHDRDDLVDHGMPGHGEPHREAHQQVAQHALEERLAERQPRLRGGDLHVSGADRAAVHRAVVGQVDHHRESHGADRIGRVHDGPVAQQLRGADLAIGPGHHHQVVAGKQLRAGHRDQDQPEREHQSAEHPRRREAQRRVARDQREVERAQADECAGEDAEHRGLQERQPRLGDADELHLLGDFPGGVRVQAKLEVGHVVLRLVQRSVAASRGRRLTPIRSTPQVWPRGSVVWMARLT